MPANYKVPAHHHPIDEFVTVISGDFRVGQHNGSALPRERVTQGETL
jgi:quercetin dioxygenase-like cupin family protein